MNDDKPLTVNHENSKLYASLKQCMLNNENLRREIVEMQMQLVDAAEMIERLTKEMQNGN